jgi:hypothetical protein
MVFTLFDPKISGVFLIFLIKHFGQGQKPVRFMPSKTVGTIKQSFSNIHIPDLLCALFIIFLISLSSQPNHNSWFLTAKEN